MTSPQCWVRWEVSPVVNDPKAVEEWTRTLADIDALVASPGWEHFQRAMKSAAQAAYSGMEKGEVSEMPKHFGAYNAIQSMMTWAERSRAVLVTRLRGVGK